MYKVPMDLLKRSKNSLIILSTLLKAANGGAKLHQAEVGRAIKEAKAVAETIEAEYYV